jgi:hypothetical protein
MTRPIIELRAKDRRIEDSVWISKHRKDVKTVNGEDGIIEKIFEVIGTENKLLVDFGAADGVYFSNSWNLLNNRGWSGLLLEPDFQFDALQDLYANRQDVVTVQDIVGFDEANNLDGHIDRIPLDLPKNFDFLSIDIDGNDVHVWTDIKNFKPRVVCIEYNHFVPLDVYMIQPRDLTLSIGSSLLATAEIARELGYQLVSVCGANAFFVLEEDYGKFGIPDNSVESMHFLGNNETKIIQGYDGTIFLAGLTTNPWKGYELDEERFQVLPSNMRKWKFEKRKIWPTKKI